MSHKKNKKTKPTDGEEEEEEEESPPPFDDNGLLFLFPLSTPKRNQKESPSHTVVSQGWGDTRQAKKGEGGGTS